MSVLLGLFAALCWGLHDLCVRAAAPGRPVLPLMAGVLAVGLVPLGLLSVFAGDWGALGGRPAALALVAGIAYALAGGGLYRAFAIGPVALVAPVVGAYPVLTLLAAATAGQMPAAGQTAAVLLIVGGIAAVAMLSPDHAEGQPGTRSRAVIWALASSAGFALTFALAQAADRAAVPAADWPAMALTRATALAATLAAVFAGRRPGPPPPPLPWPLLSAMGLLDAAALAAVTAAASLAHPEFAAVCASVFGVVTILLARLFLGERVRPPQWAAITAIFGAVGYLGL